MSGYFLRLCIVSKFLKMTQLKTHVWFVRAIAGLSDAMEQINHTLQEQTGWVWTILGGGPDPAYSDGRV